MVSLPVLGNDADIQKQVQLERERLLVEAGLDTQPIRHFKRPREKGFARREREEATILFGGLTLRHEQLVYAGLEGLGYKIGLVPTPVKADFQAGKEYGNNGQCNPTYFTVGALVNYLKDLRDNKRVPTEQILRDYVFVTAGACGPCRFGMYEAEYRLALRNSGFDGFRVLLFQQGGGLDQAAIDAGLEFNLNFFMTILNGIFVGDLLNELAYQIRPYEVVPGQTDQVFERCLEIMKERLRTKNYDQIQTGKVARTLRRFTPFSSPGEVELFLDQLKGDHYVAGLNECLQIIEEEIEVDYTRCKPICKVTGEFWAQTTEGDGNFRMFPFLEAQGAEVLVEPITTWIMYLLNQAVTHAQDLKSLVDGKPIPKWNIKARMRQELDYRTRVFQYGLAKKILFREYDRMRHALGGTTHEQVDQLHLQRVAHPYYNSRAGGGEGHLEVAKNIYYTNSRLCHMVLSLKPFGCMPSTQSDGAQAAVINKYPDMIYIPIETSGEGDVNAHSRVQMALGEAKAKCKSEFKETVAQTGYSIEQIREYVAQHRGLRRPVQQIPHSNGTVGKAARFCSFIAEKMRKEGVRLQGAASQ